MKSQGSEKKKPEKQEGFNKVFINGVSLITGKLERRKVNFPSIARLEAVNQAEKNNQTSQETEG